MLMRLLSICFFCHFLCVAANAQRITYSEPDRDDQRSLNFDIIGKVGANYLVLKNNRNENTITVFDTDMKQLNRLNLDFFPDKVINTDVLAYKDFFYLFYQYQRRNIVYCMAAKIDGNGKLSGEPVELDTTAINYFASNKLYTIINSDDKKKIMVLKVNNRNQDNNVLTTSLFSSDLSLIHKSRITIQMPDRSDFLNEFTLDNEGGLVFARPSGTSQNDNITSLDLVTKAPTADTVAFINIDVSKIYLDDVRIKADNINKRYLLTSFFSTTKRGNIEGLYCMEWDKISGRAISTVQNIFSEEMRNEARGDGNNKTAYNNYYLQKILIRKDGGFVIVSESVYTSSRGIYNNRWDYMYGSPYYSMSDYYWSSPLSSYYYPWGRWGNNNQVNRYYADNISIMSFDSTSTMQWNSIIHKSQYDDFSDNFIGYGTMNTGGDIHFLFNQLEKRTQLLNEQVLTADGKVERSPTLRNLSKEYEFMPRYAKQIGAREIIIPCQYRNYVCFAKIEF
jgi:hypothetical protein